MQQIAISVEQLFKRYATPQGEVLANDGLSFQVRRGEIFGLLGPNGAGKTTLVHQMLGLLRPSSGALVVNGIDVVRHPELVKPLVGFLPQSGIPMRWIEVERALHYTGRLRHQPDAEARRQAAELIELMGLQELRQRYVNKLSGGMQRLVNIAMALMSWPPVLILDEPTNELDPVKRRMIWSLLAQLNRERGTTCVLVTHNVLEAEQVVQRVLVMQRGRAVALGTPGELKQRLGGLVRLVLRTRDDEPLDAAAQELLGRYGTLEMVRQGQYVLHLEQSSVADVTDAVVRRIGLELLDDFRIAPPTLEDTYLELEAAVEGGDGAGAAR